MSIPAGVFFKKKIAGAAYYYSTPIIIAQDITRLTNWSSSIDMDNIPAGTDRVLVGFQVGGQHPNNTGIITTSWSVAGVSMTPLPAPSGVNGSTYGSLFVANEALMATMTGFTGTPAHNQVNVADITTRWAIFDNVDQTTPTSGIVNGTTILAATIADKALCFTAVQDTSSAVFPTFNTTPNPPYINNELELDGFDGWTSGGTGISKTRTIGTLLENNTVNQAAEICYTDATSQDVNAVLTTGTALTGRYFTLNKPGGA